MSEAQDKTNFEQGEVIFDKGDVPDCAFLILTGAVDIVLKSGGDQAVIDTLEPGEFFGEMALVDSEPRSAAAIARVPTTCVRMLRPDFEERLENSDPLTRAMLKLLVKRLRKTTQDRGTS
jgi:CRP/FNR family cyclic AMP-dependent transcriptional regulator